ncbi:MAG: tauB, partial [Gammaproteobacteria bacterium]|nr:tauB [Gammaproteobacteria bacterium]
PTSVLEDFSLDMRAGELTVLIGPSGCGKTTLLNHIAGFTRPDAGIIEMEGRAITGPGADRGVIFQQDALLPWMTVVENVAFGLKLRGLSLADRSQIARTTLELVDLIGVERHHVWELSGGMKQRVSLARALAADPQTLLMDEPFGALDALTREQMQTLVLKVWRRTGKQIVLVTHDIEEAVFLASDLVMLSARPARVASRVALEFGRRYAAGEPARRIKSDPAFIEMRERVLSWLFEQGERGDA